MDDLNLIEQYLKGDGKALEELVMKYQKKIYVHIYGMVNDVEEAKDLTQKTFLKAFKGIRDFRKESSFKTWLYQIAINTSLNHIKQRRSDDIELEESVRENKPEALTIIIEEEKRAHVKMALNELPPRQRLSIILRVFDGLSCLESARAMGCSEGAVKAHYHNGIKRLKQVLKKKGYETTP